jgi:hypothetical protein
MRFQLKVTQRRGNRRPLLLPTTHKIALECPVWGNAPRKRVVCSSQEEVQKGLNCPHIGQETRQATFGWPHLTKHAIVSRQTVYRRGIDNCAPRQAGARTHQSRSFPKTFLVSAFPPIATDLGGPAKCRDVPLADIASATGSGHSPAPHTCPASRKGGAKMRRTTLTASGYFPMHRKRELGTARSLDAGLTRRFVTATGPALPLRDALPSRSLR